MALTWGLDDPRSPIVAAKQIAFTPTTRSVESDEGQFPQGILRFAFPAHVLLIQDDFLAGNPQHVPVPQHDQSLLVVSLLDDCDSATEHCHAVTLFQGALPLAADVVFLACLD